LAELRSKVDTLITIPNERLLSIVDKKTTLGAAFASADDVLHQATRGISELLTIPGLINCDFADVRTVMQEMGDALMGTGHGSGEEKAVDAARMAIASPLLENVSISGAKGVLINVTGGEDMTLFDVNEATSLVYEAAGNDANIIFGAVIDPALSNQMRVTVIATGIGMHETVRKQDEKRVSVTMPGQSISLFNEPTAPVKPAPVVPPMPEPEPEPVEVGAHDDHYGGNGNGNGNGNGHKGGDFRVPMFSEEDRSVPAYLRRLDDRK
jgi:cell division GTPase FtsZ